MLVENQVIARDVITGDVSIIENQPEHLVFAVRVPKTTLLQNHPLLLAISEYSVSEPDSSVFHSNPQRNLRSQPWRVLKRPMLTAFLGTVLLVSMPWHRILQAFKEPPLVQVSSYLENPVLHVGEELQVRVVTKYLRPCYGDVDRVWLRAKDGGVVHSSRAPLFSTPGQETQERAFTIPQPEGLKPGHYVYRSTMHFVCDDDDAIRYTVKGSDFLIEIIP